MLVFAAFRQTFDHVCILWRAFWKDAEVDVLPSVLSRWMLFAVLPDDVGHGCESWFPRPADLIYGVQVHRRRIAGVTKMHQPGTEPGSHRWQRCILPLDH